jgi:hypothetical protein
MGSLILLLLVLDRRARVVAQSRALREAQAVAGELEDATREKEEYERRRLELHVRLQKEDEVVLVKERDLERQMAALVKKTAELKAQDESLQNRARQHQRELQDSKDVFAHQRSRLENQSHEAASLKTDLAKMSKELIELERTLADIREFRRRQAQTHSLVPYVGKHGGSRRPIYIECRGDQLIFYPEQKMLAVSSRLGIREEVLRRVAALKDHKQAYVLFLVRPRGIISYYESVASLQGIELDYGYELIDADWLLDFPGEDADPAKTMWVAAKTTPPSDGNSAAVRETTHVKGVSFGHGRLVSSEQRIGAKADAGPGRQGAPSAPLGGEGLRRSTPRTSVYSGAGSGIGPRAPSHGTGFIATGAPGDGNAGEFAQASSQRGTPVTGGLPGARSKGPTLGDGPATEGTATGGEGGIDLLHSRRQEGPGVRGIFGTPSQNNSAQPGGTSLFPSLREQGPGEGAASGQPGTAPPVAGAAQPGDTGPLPSPQGEGPGVRANSGQPKTSGGVVNPEASEGNASSAGGATVAGGAPTILASRPGMPSSGTNQTPDQPVQAGMPGNSGSGGTGTPGNSGAQNNGQPGGGPSSMRADPLGALTPSNSKQTARKTPVIRTGWLNANRDWIIPIDCTAEGVTIRQLGRSIPVQSFSQGEKGSENLQAAIRDMIARRQASVPPGDPPYRPIIRFRVRRDGLRSYYHAYPALEPLGARMSRENLEEQR